jgi:phage nucleotide-binding protein
MKITPAKDLTVGNNTYLIYGAPGSGKTTALADLPGKTLVLDIDRTSRVLKGKPNVDVALIDNIHTWDDWNAALAELAKGHPYQNICVDNISELERCILSDLGSQGKNKGVPAQADYQYMQFKLVNSLRAMKSLNCNIVLTAWETTDIFTDPSGAQYSRFFPQINSKIVNNICGLCDVVAKLLVKDDKRVFILESQQNVFAKNQIDTRRACLSNELITAEVKKNG